MQLESSRITRYTTLTATSSNPLRTLSSLAHQALPHRRNENVCPSVLSAAATESSLNPQKCASIASGRENLKLRHQQVYIPSHQRSNMTLIRAKSVKHCEYEILAWLTKTDGYDHYEDLHHLARDGLVPRGDDVALNRFNSAQDNLLVVLNNMQSKRVQHLPDNHDMAVTE